MTNDINKLVSTTHAEVAFSICDLCVNNIIMQIAYKCEINTLNFYHKHQIMPLHFEKKKKYAFRIYINAI